MENISSLIKEAKPMYFARKRRNNIIKGTLSMLVCVFMLGTFYNLSQPSFFDYDLQYQETYLLSEGSVIANMGLPTDEYGLFMVN